MAKNENLTIIIRNLPAALQGKIITVDAPAARDNGYGRDCYDIDGGNAGKTTKYLMVDDIGLRLCLATDNGKGKAPKTKQGGQSGQTTAIAHAAIGIIDADEQASFLAGCGVLAFAALAGLSQASRNAALAAFAK